MRCLGALILAVGLLCGCGVGADESYDTVGTTAQAADSTTTSGTSGASDDGKKKDENPNPLPGTPPSVVALPQDPIPLFIGQVVTTSSGATAVVVAPAAASTTAQPVSSGH